MTKGKQKEKEPNASLFHMHGGEVKQLDEENKETLLNSNFIKNISAFIFKKV